MSKKDYQAIADAIYRTRKELGESATFAIDMVQIAISDVFKANNGRFSRELFRQACETGSCRGMKARS